MKVYSIVDNISNVGFPVEHGLSLYIQLDNGLDILFDMGQSELFYNNAKRLGLNILDVDLAIISHGHYDHGGGLGTFLNLNKNAIVYLHQSAFEAHFSLRESKFAYIGLNQEQQGKNRICLCDRVTNINQNMLLFTNVSGQCCWPAGNERLFGPTNEINDNFNHEQNLIIRENDNIVLFAGCSHKGIVNIIRTAEKIIGKPPSHVFAGLHLMKSGLDSIAENLFINTLADELKSFTQCKYYTMHCTGIEAYKKLNDIMGIQIEYLSCGESAEI